MADVDVVQTGPAAQPYRSGRDHRGLPAAFKGADAGGILQISAINFGWVILLGTALHIYLYVFICQQSRLKFDIRPMEKSGRFTFGNQVWDNIFWTLASSVVFWTLWAILYFYVAAKGWIPTLETVGQSPVWFVLFFFLIRFWQSFHFYWIHRLIHMPLLFKHVHSLHHRNVNVGPWSGLAMHPVEGRLLSPPAASPFFRMQLRVRGNAPGSLVRQLPRRD